MAIKTKSSRDTYRSNVKIRPLRQNGLEAQYQGLDITEVNIDHAALPILGRSGHGDLRNYTKVNKEYIVDVDAEEHFPKASLVFAFNKSAWSVGSNVGINQIDTKIFTLVTSGGISKTFEFTTDPSFSNGVEIPGTTYFAVSIHDNNFSVATLLTNTILAIEAAFGKEIFAFEKYQAGQEEVIDGEIVKVTQDKIYIKMLSGELGLSNLIENNSGSFLDVTQNTFQDQKESHRWRLNGFREHKTVDRMFYEDLRVDALQSVVPHSRRRTGFLFRQAQATNSSISTFSNSNGFIVNMDSEIAKVIDPKTQDRFTKKISDEVLIRQTPRREEIFGTYRTNHTWREDPHYLSMDQQTWSNMAMYATMYSSDLEAHIAKMLDSNFVAEQYHDNNLLSGRIDVFNRLSRIFDIHNELLYQRHSYSVFDQFLDPIQDFQNLQTNKFSKKDDLLSDRPFEDVRGKRGDLAPTEDLSKDNSVLFVDYFDQPELETHDFIEQNRFSRIDTAMLDVLVQYTQVNSEGKAVPALLDRRQWEETDFVYTSTGFVSSQATPQDGIIYREMKR
tara:strand:- start:151 stop:1827 length:1677 start_codon:yes stop_codon:yes gene_type:complete